MEIKLGVFVTLTAAGRVVVKKYSDIYTIYEVGLLKTQIYYKPCMYFLNDSLNLELLLGFSNHLACN